MVDESLLVARFKITKAELKEIRTAFERMHPEAVVWRKADGNDDMDYYSRPLQQSFLSFRDGWLARSAHPTGDDRAP
jgi:hypothetical protein